MNWQDPTIAFAVLVLSLTAIPMIQQRVTPPLMTSVPLLGAASLLVLAYSSLGLWLSVAVEVLSILLWSVLFWRAVQARFAALSIDPHR